MKDRTLKSNLYHSLGQEVQPKRLGETINYCTEIMKEQMFYKEEPRTSFFQYLSDVFRFEGIPIFILQAVTLFFVCLMIASVADIPQNIPIFMPLFVVAAMPVLFKSQLYGMSEIEAVTRASGAQIMLAKLILSGAANLVCITILLFMETYQQNSCKGIGQMILYCLVPYLVCMVGLLRVIRMRKKEGLPVCVFIMLGSCVFWATATGLWLIMFVVFSAFFLQEIRYIAAIRKEGKMYGIIA